MRKFIALLLTVVFAFAILGCTGDAKDKKIPVNINPTPKDKTTTKAQKPAQPPELVWLGETFGKYFDDDGLKQLMDNLPTMSAEDFESTLRGLGTDEDKPAEDDIVKAMEIFNAWKAKSEPKETEKAVETGDMPG